MGLIDFTFEVVGEKQVHFMMDDLGQQVSSMKVPFGDIANDYYAGEHATFVSEGAFEGKPSWAPLSAMYEKWKRSRWGIQPLLVASGALRMAATERSAAGSVFRMDDTSLAMGADVPVGGWNLANLHQQGTGKMPAREIIRITPAQEKRWVKVIHDFLFYRAQNVQQKAVS